MALHDVDVRVYADVETTTWLMKKGGGRSFSFRRGELALPERLAERDRLYGDSTLACSARGF
jgi:hypothetical protein